MNRVVVPDLKAKKRRGERIAMLTAYDATMARLLDRAGLDVILVGDSVGMVALGYDNTLTVTLDAMVHHTQAVTRGAQRALVVADMPFLTYQISISDAVRNAGRLMQEGGAAAGGSNRGYQAGSCFRGNRRAAAANHLDARGRHVLGDKGRAGEQHVEGSILVAPNDAPGEAAPGHVAQDGQVVDEGIDLALSQRF